jgi:hypothetical protein
MVFIDITRLPRTGTCPNGDTARERALSVLGLRDSARMACFQKLEQLLGDKEELVLPAEFIVHFGLPSEAILQTGLALSGLRYSIHVATDARMPGRRLMMWRVALEVLY